VPEFLPRASPLDGTVRSNHLTLASAGVNARMIERGEDIHVSAHISLGWESLPGRCPPWVGFFKRAFVDQVMAFGTCKYHNLTRSIQLKDCLPHMGHWSQWRNTPGRRTEADIRTPRHLKMPEVEAVITSQSSTRPLRRRRSFGESSDAATRPVKLLKPTSSLLSGTGSPCRADAKQPTSPWSESCPGRKTESPLPCPSSHCAETGRKVAPNLRKVHWVIYTGITCAGTTTIFTA